jgi:outer membrane protein OmpA-like peptidoglycan-associated protein
VKCFGAGNLVHSGTDEHQRRADIIWMKPGSPPLQIGPPPQTSSRVDSVAAARVDSVVAAKKRKQTLKDLGKMKEDELLVIENLLFKSLDSRDRQRITSVLDELVGVLKDYPQLKIRIEGHICCGTNSKETDKLKLGYHLSVDRARAVKAYLEEHR